MHQVVQLKEIYCPNSYMKVFAISTMHIETILMCKKMTIKQIIEIKNKKMAKKNLRQNEPLK